MSQRTIHIAFLEEREGRHDTFFPQPVEDLRIRAGLLVRKLVAGEPQHDKVVGLALGQLVQCVVSATLSVNGWVARDLTKRERLKRMV